MRNLTIKVHESIIELRAHDDSYDKACALLLADTDSERLGNTITELMCMEVEA